MVEKVATFREMRLGKHTCKHYWLIEGANASTSRGVCEQCGATKVFHNDLKSCIRPDKDQYLDWLRSGGRETRPERDILAQIEDLFRTFTN